MNWVMDNKRLLLLLDMLMGLWLYEKNLHFPMCIERYKGEMTQLMFKIYFKILQQRKKKDK